MDQRVKEDLKGNVPLAQLADFVSQHDEAVPVLSLSKDQVIEKIDALVAGNISAETDLTSLISKYKFAGKCSVSWSVSLKEVDLNSLDLETILQEKFGVNPFKEEVKPEIKRQPSFNKAEWLDDDKTSLMLEFVNGAQSYFVEEDYELVKVTPMQRTNAFLKMTESSFFIEIRANIQKAATLHRMVSYILGVETIIVEFSDMDIQKIKEGLVANKRTAKHKQHSGDFDTLAIAASPTLTCLDDSIQYQGFLDSGEVREARFEFEYKNLNGLKTNVSFHISTRGNVWFQTSVPEEIIEYVFSTVRSVKGF